jgi:hypothetical protein
MQVNIKFPFIAFTIHTKTFINKQPTHKLPKNEGRRMGLICCARPGLVRGLGGILGQKRSAHL